MLYFAYALDLHMACTYSSVCVSDSAYTALQSVSFISLRKSTQAPCLVNGIRVHMCTYTINKAWSPNSLVDGKCVHMCTTLDVILQTNIRLRMHGQQKHFTSTSVQDTLDGRYIGHSHFRCNLYMQPVCHNVVAQTAQLLITDKPRQVNMQPQHHTGS